LEPGNLLVFYTDGLIEFDHNIIEGEEKLAQAVAAEVESQTPDPSAAIARRIIVDPPKDDVALLTISIASQSLDHVDLVTSSVPTSARVIRQALRRFALSTGLDNVRTSDFLTASGEAISNVIEHAYGIDQGTLHVRAFREDGDIVVKVMDRGAWRDGLRQGSGRGLPIMRALMKEVEIERSGQGTTVSMRMPLTEQASDDPSNVPALTS
jgi:anti-sigma regulatory factor (Ser/Thr protein kinase)